MAIFKKDKKAEAETKVPMTSGKKEEEKNASYESTETKKVTVSHIGGNGAVEHILKKPHITEKASMHAENNVYVFEVSKRANKTLIKNAVKELYKVSPIKINIVNSPAKNVTSKGIKGTKTGKKKALVYLKKGDTIEII
jgi:large subunit ribosomal protein L23